MPIAINSKSANVEANIASLTSVVERLVIKGYDPLIFQAKSRFLGIFGEAEDQSLLNSTFDMEEVLKSPLDYLLRGRYSTMRRMQNGLLLAGELYFTPARNGILYLAVILPDPLPEEWHTRESPELRLEIGYVGDDSVISEFDAFTNSVTELLVDTGVRVKWASSRTCSRQFTDLAESKETRFVSGTDVAEEDLKLARSLESISMRDIALTAKRSRGILASDLMKGAGGPEEEVRDRIKVLTEVNLLEQQYVVICRRTSNQVNRVDSQEALAKMGEMKILCACGRPIYEERIEELYSPTSELHRMLDHSYWMSASLVNVLTELNLERERILLDLIEGPEEVDAFIDVDGTLLMVELKDAEFSMGHAYPFAGRIGLYKPSYAIIVSTKGIAPEVKDYFMRVEPEAEIVYVERLNDLPSAFDTILQRVRTRRSLQVLESFDAIASVEMPLTKILANRIGADSEELEKDL